MKRNAFESKTRVVIFMSQEDSAKLYHRYFSRISEIIGRKHFTAIGESEFNRVIGEISFDSPIRILDIGCGNGRTGIYFSKKTAAEVFAVEPSREILDEAKKNVIEAGLEERFEFVQNGFFDLAFNESFDLALGIDTFCYFPDKRLAFDHAVESLASGGYLTFTDYFLKEPRDPISNPFFEFFSLHQPMLFSDYQQEARSAGFDLVFFEDYTSVFQKHWSWVRDQVVSMEAEILKEIPKAYYDQYRVAVESNLVELERGVYQYLFALLKKC